MILQHAQNTPNQSSFVACLLCCHLWYNLGLSLLCNGITLRNTNLQAFLSRFPSRNLASVRFLTISIEASYDDLELFGSIQARRLQRLSEAIPRMINLSSFSFTFSDPRSGNPHPLQLPRPVITELVYSLPTSCVNLEIDTNGLDFLVPHTPHLCHALRFVLPRLQHLRLRLADICPGIFAWGFNRDGTIEDPVDINPMAAPSLKTIVINCRTGIWSAGACGRRPKTDAHIALLHRLYEFAARGAFPAIERLWLVHKPRLQFIGSQFLCYQRCDIIQNHTWAIPFIPGMYPSFAENPDVCLMRTPEGQEVLLDEPVAERLVEGQTWETTLSGSRLPAAVMRRWNLECAKPRLPSNLELHQGMQHCSCSFHSLRRNESITGVKMMSPVQREGIIDDVPVRVICPEGWRWVENVLERVPTPETTLGS